MSDVGSMLPERFKEVTDRLQIRNHDIQATITRITKLRRLCVERFE